jgi:hypothetical protein
MNSPGTLAEAYAAASMHVVRVSSVRMAIQLDAAKGGVQSRGRRGEGRRNRVCYFCGRIGNKSRGCKATKEQKNAYKAKRDTETAHAAVRQEAQER